MTVNLTNPVCEREKQTAWRSIRPVLVMTGFNAAAALTAILFGGLYILYLFIPTGTNLAVKELYKMLPYIVTIIVLIITSLRNRREDQPPQSLGLSYFREDR